MRWTVLIPAKSLPRAKTRLLPGSIDVAAHARLVLAIRDDTVSAARAAANVARVVIVTDRDGAAGEHGPVDHDCVATADRYVITQSVPGLNQALLEGASFAAAQWPDDGTAALVGDLPALVPAQLADALEQAAAHPRAFVPDAAGAGTTLLTARPDSALRPAFGVGSAARHATWAVPLDAGPGLRHDVDTHADLQAAAAHGLGPATRALVPGAPARGLCSCATGMMSS